MDNGNGSTNTHHLASRETVGRMGNVSFFIHRYLPPVSRTHARRVGSRGGGGGGVRIHNSAE